MPAAFSSSSNMLYIKFSSDYSTTGRGFRLYFDGGPPTTSKSPYFIRNFKLRSSQWVELLSLSLHLGPYFARVVKPGKKPISDEFLSPRPLLARISLRRRRFLRLWQQWTLTEVLKPCFMILQFRKTDFWDTLDPVVVTIIIIIIIIIINSLFKVG